MEKTTDHPLDRLEEYLDGSLPEAELTEIKTHLESCAQCQQELLFVQQLKARAKKIEPAEPSDLAIKRLHQQIDELPAKQSAPQTGRTVAPWWRTAFAAALSVVIIQAGYIGFRPAIEDPGVLRGYDKDQLLLKVRFAPAATERNIRLLLRTNQARIVNGPDSRAFYQVVFNVKKDNQRKVKQTVNTLRSHKPTVLEVSLP